MKTPHSLGNWLNSALVSLTLLAFAALMLAFPVYRVAAANWPEPIVERVYADGRVRLRESGPIYGDDGVVRSRPFNAARVEFENGSSVLGYVIAIRVEGESPRKPPGDLVWRPRGGQCELALKSPARTVEWVSCDRISEISHPNTMHLLARARLAFSRAIPALAVY